MDNNVKVTKVTIPLDIAGAFVRSMDNKDVKLILDWYEKGIMSSMPDLINVNRNYALCGKLQLLASMKANIQEARRVVDDRNKQSK